MHEVIFYISANGKNPVYDYMVALKKSGSKDSLIKLSKIQDYIKVLSCYGTYVGMPYIKHLNGEIWELRPARNRVLFAGITGGKFILLHCFLKRTRKTPAEEIEKAKKELADFKKRSGLE